MVPGLEMATKLVMDLCGGSPSEIVVAGKSHGEDRIIEFPVTEVKRLAGIDVPLPEIKRNSRISVSWLRAQARS